MGQNSTDVDKYLKGTLELRNEREPQIDIRLISIETRAINELSLGLLSKGDDHLSAARARAGIRGRNKAGTATLNFGEAAFHLGGPCLFNIRIFAKTRE